MNEAMNAESARKTERPGWDEWTGSPAALIAAGVINADQVPGEPGRPKVMMTFHRGKRVTSGVCVDRDESYIQIQRLSGQRLEVTVGLTTAERARRDVARESEEDPWRRFDAPEVQQRLAWLRARADVRAVLSRLGV